jgi:mono/diheme cytochrome c family protein
MTPRLLFGYSLPRFSGRTKVAGVSAAICVAALLSGTISQGQTPDAKRAKEDVYAQLSKAPKKAAARRNPLERDPDALAAGAKLYDQHCAECHGELAEGTKKAPTLRADAIEQATPGTLFWLLTNGVVRRGMPVWSKLPEPQRWLLVSYI